MKKDKKRDVSLRLTPELYDKLRKYADKLGLTCSSAAKMLIFKCLDSQDKE